MGGLLIIYTLSGAQKQLLIHNNSQLSFLSVCFWQLIWLHVAEVLVLLILQVSPLEAECYYNWF
jgi:hypothetical protein